MNRDNKVQAQPDCDEVRKKLDKLDRLLSMLPELASKIDKERLIKHFVREARKLVNADHTHVRSVDWIDEKLVLLARDPEEDPVSKSPEYSSVSVKKGAEKAIVGRVFRNGESEIIQDVQKDEDFIKYLEEIKDENLIKYLKTIERAIVVPLLLDRKAIGVLTATRLRKTENTELPLAFTKDDSIILSHFATHAAIALRNAWLSRAATWQPLQDDRGETVTVEVLCQEVVKEVVRNTGATDSRVRFVDWEGKRIVPGTVRWPYDTGREPQNLEVCARKIGHGGCVAGEVAGTLSPKLSNDLKNETLFIEFVKCVEKQKSLTLKQLEALERWQKAVEEAGETFNPQDFFKEEFKTLQEHEYPEEEKEKIEKRLNVLTNLTNIEQVKDSLRMQKNAVEELYNAQEKYIEYLKTLNSEVAVPILLGKNLCGVLNAHSSKKGWFTESDQAILQALAGCVATALMGHQQRVLNEIQKIEQKMTAGWEFDEIAELVADGIKQEAFLIVPTERTFPLLYICKTPVHPKELVDDQQHFGGKFEPQPRVSVLKKLEKENIVLSDYLSISSMLNDVIEKLRKGEIVLSKYEREEIELLTVPIRNDGLGFQAIRKLAEKPMEPVFIVRENVDDPVSGGSDSAKKHGVVSTACLPLAFGGIVYGLLYIHILERHFFTQLEKETLTLFAAQAAIVLKNVPALKRSFEEPTYERIYGAELIKQCILPLHEAGTAGY